MPKGIRTSVLSSKRAVLERIRQALVPQGARVFPDSVCDEHPEGIPLPDGVRVRSGSGVEVRFDWEGKRVSEVLRGTPTVSFVIEAGKKRERVVQLISLGKFDDEAYAAEFPDSKRAQARVRAGARSFASGDAVTVGMALDDWLAAAWGALSVNTRRDYVRCIRNQLKPMVLDSLKMPEDAYAPGCSSGAQPPSPTFDGSPGPVLADGAPASTSTVAMRMVWVDVPLAEGERRSTRRRRRLAQFVQSGARGLSPLLTRSERRYIPVELPHTCLAHLRVDAIRDVEASAIRQLLVDTHGSLKRAMNILSPLRQAFERLQEMQVIAVNPFARLKPIRPSAVQHLPRAARLSAEDQLEIPAEELVDFGHMGLDEEEGPDPFTTEEMEAILRHLDPMVVNQAIFAFHTGLRTGELLALRVKDVDLKRCRVHVRLSKSRAALKPTKTGKSRWVDLLPPALEALKAQIELLGAPGGWVFPNPVTLDAWANESKFTKRWKRALEEAGVRYRRPYQMRHTYATMMLSAGEPLLYVAKQMGHADWRMVQQVYGRWMSSHASQTAGSAITQARQAKWAGLPIRRKRESSDLPLRPSSRTSARDGRRGGGPQPGIVGPTSRDTARDASKPGSAPKVPGP